MGQPLVDPQLVAYGHSSPLVILLPANPLAPLTGLRGRAQISVAPGRPLGSLLASLTLVTAAAAARRPRGAEG